MERKAMNNTKQVTIDINEETYRSLEAIAKAMNSVGWCGDDNTVKTVIEEWCLYCNDIDDVKANICDDIDTNTDNAKEADERLAKLAEAFKSI